MSQIDLHVACVPFLVDLDLLEFEPNPVQMMRELHTAVKGTKTKTMRRVLGQILWEIGH